MLKNVFPSASRLVYGCMGLGGSWDASPVTSAHIKQAHQVIEAALDSGITVFDHADIYTFGKAEKAFGEVLKASPSLRDNMTVQSKCAIRFKDDAGPKRYDLSAACITASVDDILQRLNIEQLDILLLHRPDPLMELEEVATTISDLQASGKIRHLGVSNMHGHQINYLQSALGTPIVANQLEMSLAFRDWLEDGITTNSNHNRQIGYASGTLEYCMMNKVQLQAWGSLAQGKYSGGHAEFEEDVATATLVNQLASQYGVPPEAIVLGWLMRHPAGIQPVIGTTNIDRIKHCVQANNLSLSREHWYALLQSARGHEVP